MFVAKDHKSKYNIDYKQVYALVTQLTTEQVSDMVNNNEVGRAHAIQHKLDASL